MGVSFHIREELAALALAVQFMTRLPVANVTYSPDRFSRSRAHYPLAGAFIGLLCGSVFVGANAFFGEALSLLLAIAAGLLVTGALHEDGLADVCDGLGGGRSAEHALAIMKDSRLGTYGVLGLGLMLSLKMLALLEVPAAVVPWLLVAGHCVSRAAVLPIIATQRYLRAQSGDTRNVGKAASAAGNVSQLALTYAGVVACAVLAAPPLLLEWLAAPAVIVAAGLGAVAGVLGMWYLFHRRLKGYTGDCLGAAQQTSELGLYLAVAAVF